jgi:hypothetical protein
MRKGLSRVGAGLGALVAAGLVALGPAAGPRPATAQHDHGAQAGAQPPAGGVKPGVRITMDELHRAGGVPPGWRFAWPAGDPKRGREAFVKLECYQCHEVQGESFPPVAQDPARRGPALTGMGGHHPAEYFAEAILHPNAVIVTGPGHTGSDGLSVMPDFRDSLTLAETIDLVAYVKSLTGGAPEHGPHDAGGPVERETVVGNYRVRVAYAAHGGDAGRPDHGQHQHHGGQHHGQSQPAAPKGGASAGHLMVFVADTTRGEPLPYLPVSATIHGASTAPRTVRLAPMVSDKGFHYGADVRLPARLTKITVAIGKPMPALRLTPSESARFGHGAEVSFEWGK